MGDRVERLSSVIEGRGGSEGTEEQAGEKRRRRVGRDCFLIVICKGRGPTALRKPSNLDCRGQ